MCVCVFRIDDDYSYIINVAPGQLGLEGTRNWTTSVCESSEDAARCLFGS